MEKFSFALIPSGVQAAFCLEWKAFNHIAQDLAAIRAMAGKVIIARDKYLSKIDWKYLATISATSDVSLQGMRLVSDYIGGRLWYPSNKNRPSLEKPYLLFEKSEGEDLLSGFRNLPIYVIDSQSISLNLVQEILRGDESYQLANLIQGIPLVVYEQGVIQSDGILFLDRDGVINQDNQYVYKIDEIVFMPGIFELIKHANQLGKKVVVITNQSGIGRGYYTEEDVLKLHAWMAKELAGQGAKIDGWYYSAEHPQGSVTPLRGRGVFRKPYPGMFLQAAADLQQSLLGGIMIGDKLSDHPMLSGITTYHLQGNYPLRDVKTYDSLVDIMNLI